VEVPIQKQGDYLIVSLQSAVPDVDLIRLRHNLLAQVGKFRSRGVVIDVTAMDVMDSFSTATLRSTAQAVRLRGAQAVIVGIQPDVAFAMVQLGLSLQGVETALDLEEGLAILHRRTKGGKTGGR
jgi:rsbT antagonist protein RsbS